MDSFLAGNQVFFFLFSSDHLRCFERMLQEGKFTVKTESLWFGFEKQPPFSLLHPFPSSLRLTRFYL